LREVRLLGPDDFFGAPVVTYYGPGEMDASGNTTPIDTIARESANGVITHIGYDPETLQAKSLKTTLPGAENPVQNLTYSYYDSGDIKTIIDNEDSTRTQNFNYDANFRLTSATGIYGNLTYQYSAEGNLTQKGSLGIKYGNQCATPGPVGAACEDTSGNVYKYDLNGNMINRKGRDLIYDAEDRLIEIQAGGVVKQKYIYDHSGSRVVKKREDGTVVYNVDGLYEILVKPGSPLVYRTKYIYGAEGDLAAQITREGILEHVQAASAKIVELASAGFVTKLFVKTKETIGKHFAQTRTPVVLYLIIILIAALILAFIKTNFKLYPFRFVNENGARGPTAIVLIFAFSLAILGPACQGQASGEVEPVSWIDLPVGGYVDIPDVGQDPGTNNDTALNGQPTIGAFFLHPNHQGSTSLITDAYGALVSEIHYKPYGEIYRPASNGEDISRNKYTGQQEDVESELMYYGSRFYDPAIGRFISADTIIDSGAGNMGFNRYMYVAGNPVNYTDPSGHFLVTAIIIGAIVGAVVGGTHGQVFNQQAWENFDGESALLGAVIGAVSAVAGWAVGTAVIGTGGAGAPILGHALGSATSGTVNNGLMAAVNGGDIGEAMKVGFTSGLLGGFVSGGFLLSGVPIMSASTIANAAGGSVSGFVGAAMTGGDVGIAALAGFGWGFGSAWASGILNRELMTDGVIRDNKAMIKTGEKDANGNDVYEPVKKGAIVGLKSVKGDRLAWLWSTLVGGYSHASTVGDDQGSLYQYGTKNPYNMSGRGFKILGYTNTPLDLTATRLHPNYTSYKRTPTGVYNSMTNNCTTTLSQGYGLPNMWTPYNVHSYYNYTNSAFWQPW
ncbi:MAG: RHS repeat-associated core domain-containing protein, partial [Leptospirales bacterium]